MSELAVQTPALRAFQAYTWSLLTTKLCLVHENCDGTCSIGTDHNCDPQLINISLLLYASPGLPPPPIAPNPTSGSLFTYSRVRNWLPFKKEFTYSPLDTNRANIRLIRVKPALFKEDIIDCELLHISLDDKPVFAALSYAWGPPVFDQKILVNGNVFHVTTTLNKALLSYRRDSYDRPNIYIWADAICINQNDISERSQQVSLMSRIYSMASYVRIDFGDTGASTSWSEGYILLHKLSHAHAMRSLAPESQPFVKYLLTNEVLPSLSHPSWRIYDCMYYSLWLRRTWVLQEICLAKKAEISYGMFTFTWKDLKDSLKIFNEVHFDHSPELDIPTSVGRMNMMYVVKMEQLCAREAALVQNAPVQNAHRELEIMLSTQNFSSTDPRDKIIGVLGLLERGTSQPYPFRADYSVDCSTLYHRFAIHLMRQKSTCRVLEVSGLYRHQMISQVPTWVPDWTAVGSATCPHPIILFAAKKFSAGGRYLPSVIFANRKTDIYPGIIIMPGSAIDTITLLSPTLEALDDPSALERVRRFLRWHDLVQQMAHTSGLSEKRPAVYGNVYYALTRTLVINSVLKPDHVRDIGEDDFLVEAYTRTIHNMARAAANASDGGATEDLALDVILRENRTIMCSAMNAEPYRRALLATCDKRKFAVTAKGYLALVPNCTELGDRIGVVLGCRVPLVLRSQGDIPLKRESSGEVEVETGYQIVGDSYVHGIMHGEVVRLKSIREGKLFLV